MQRHSIPIDNKHSIVADLDDNDNLTLYLAKRKADGTLERIPPEEPTILFRGRDKLAVPMLVRYRQFCVADGCNEQQLEILDGMIEKFLQFAKDNPGTMKQPGITRGR